MDLLLKIGLPGLPQEWSFLSFYYRWFNFYFKGERNFLEIKIFCKNVLYNFIYLGYIIKLQHVASNVLTTRVFNFHWNTIIKHYDILYFYKIS